MSERGDEVILAALGASNQHRATHPSLLPLGCSVGLRVHRPQVRGYGETLTGVASYPMNPRLPGPANEDKGGGSGHKRKKGLFSRIVKPKSSAKRRRKRKGKGNS